MPAGLAGSSESIAKITACLSALRNSSKLHAVWIGLKFYLIYPDLPSKTRTKLIVI